MRIAVFSTDDFVPPAGGAELATGEIMRRLSHIQFDMYSAHLDFKRPHEETIGNVTVIRIGWGTWPLLNKLLFAFRAASYALKRHRTKPYCAAWAIMASYGGYAAYRFKQKTNIPYLLTLQEGDPLDSFLYRIAELIPAFRRIFKNADALHAISQFLLAWGEKMGFQGTQHEIVPNGVDIELFTRSLEPSDIKSKRCSFGFSEDATILITTSRLVVKNAVGDIVSALTYLPPTVCLVICGFGPLEDDLRGQVKQGSLEERVRFTGIVSHTELPLLLQASDIFVRPSLSEGLGNAFLEAMAVRKPIIGTLVGGIPDFLKDGETGFVCKPKNPESIALAVTRITALPKKERAAVLDRAEHLIHERYIWGHIRESVRCTLTTLCNK